MDFSESCDSIEDQSSESISSDMSNEEDILDETEELESASLDFFYLNDAKSKEDVTRMVTEYHINNRRNFKVNRSDKRRISFLCKSGTQCEFKLNFNFSDLTNPSIAAKHTCIASPIDKFKCDYICNLTFVVDYMNTQKRMANTAGLDAILKANGFKLGYNARFRIIHKLRNEMFGKDEEQYALIKSYCNILISKQQLVLFEKVENVFYRLCVIYREGLQGFAYYYERGLQIDATFIKNETKGTLMVACYKDGNNNIRIIGVAVVQCENEENWTWFLSILKDNLVEQPEFIISDRDKGLLNAVNIFSGVHHAYCFRHVMENFNQKFKDKQLKKDSWGIAKARNDCQRNNSMLKVSRRDGAIEWFENIGFDHLTLMDSPVCRYGMVTSNNVESTNSRFRHLRKLPIMELLIGIEAIVSLDFLSGHQAALAWNGLLTRFARKMYQSNLQAKNYVQKIVAINQYIVSVGNIHLIRKSRVSSRCRKYIILLLWIFKIISFSLCTLNICVKLFISECCKSRNCL